MHPICINGRYQVYCRKKANDISTVSDMLPASVIGECATAIAPFLVIIPQMSVANETVSKDLETANFKVTAIIKKEK